MTKRPILTFHSDGAFLGDRGLSQQHFERLGNELLDSRREMLEVDAKLWQENRSVPPEKEPLDAGFVDLPQRILAEYRSNRSESELGQILETAKRLRDQVDRVVVLGIGGSYMGAFALMQACCQPYFNELSRGDRGGRPRMYFEGNNVDNDSTQGLLHLLRQSASHDPIDRDWAIVVISKSGGTIETAVAFRQFLRELKQVASPDQIAERVIPVTGKSGKLFELSQALGCRQRFVVPDGVGGRFSILSPVGLLPAAILGLDVVALLEGAVAMNDHFCTAEPGANAVLDYVAVNALAEREYGANTRILSVWNKSLEWVGLWYDQLLAESLGKQEKGALPLTVVNTRDLHSRAQQHQEGRRDKILNNLTVDQWKFDALPVGTGDCDLDELDVFAQRTLPEMMNAAIRGTNQAYCDDGRLTTEIRLPRVDEFSLGQLFQMLMLATVLEGRWMGINPYGQPGVEAYKRNMKQILSNWDTEAEGEANGR